MSGKIDVDRYGPIGAAESGRVVRCLHEFYVLHVVVS